MLKKIKSDYITSELNKFKSDYDKEFNKKRLIKQRKLKCPACDFEEKRRQYCRQVYDLYYGALKRNYKFLFTYTDLIEERQAAVEAILDAGHIPACMELFKAGNQSQLNTICKGLMNPMFI